MRLLVVPLVLGLWALLGMELTAPDGTQFKTGWAPMLEGFPPPSTQLNSLCYIPASGARPRRWARSDLHVIPLGGWSYSVLWVRPLSRQEVQQIGFTY